MKNHVRDRLLPRLSPLLLTTASLLFAASSTLLGVGELKGGTISASSDAVLEDSTGSGTFDTINPLDLANHGLYIRDFLGASPNFEDRAVILFNLAGLPSNAQVKGLSLNFDEESYANGVGNIVINGYSSNGTISLADATAASSQLGTYDAIGVLGSRSVSLSTSYLQSLLAGGASYLGIRLQGSEYGDNTALGSIEQNLIASTIPAPTLIVTLSSVPEPSSVVLLISGALAVIGLRIRLRPGRVA